MEFHLNLQIQAREVYEVHIVRGPHGTLEQVQLCAGIGRFFMKSIFESWFLGKNLALKILPFHLPVALQQIQF